MKLLYITNGITGAGGLERVISLKAENFIKRYNYDTHILSLNEEGRSCFYEFNSKITFHSISVNPNSIFYIYLYVKRLKTIVKKIKPDTAYT